MVADTEAFGQEITNLNKYFANKYEPEKYANLERQVVLSLPVEQIERRLFAYVPELMFIEDAKTGKTLADAVFLLVKLLNDPHVTEEVADRLDLRDPKMLALEVPHSAEFDLQSTLKNTLLHNPEAIINAIQDPEVLSSISDSIMEYLSSEGVKEGIHTLQGVVGMLEITYANVLDNGENPLFVLKDRTSGMTLAQTLKVLANIIETPAFGRELKNLLSSQVVTDLHTKTKEMVAKVTNSHPSEISAEELTSMLNNFGLKLSLKDVSNILQLSKNGQLVRKTKRLLEKIDGISDLNSDKLTQFLKDMRIELSSESLKQVLSIVASSTPESASSMLKDLELNVTPRQAETLIDLVRDIKSKLDVRSTDEVAHSAFDLPDEMDSTFGEQTSNQNINASSDEPLDEASGEQFDELSEGLSDAIDNKVDSVQDEP